MAQLLCCNSESPTQGHGIEKYAEPLQKREMSTDATKPTTNAIYSTKRGDILRTVRKQEQRSDQVSYNDAISSTKMVLFDNEKRNDQYPLRGNTMPDSTPMAALKTGVPFVGQNVPIEKIDAQADSTTKERSVCVKGQKHKFISMTQYIS